MRINEFAKTTGRSSAEIMALMRAMGIAATNHAQAISDEQVVAIRARIEKAAAAKKPSVVGSGVSPKTTLPTPTSGAHKTSSVIHKTHSKIMPPIVVVAPPEKKKIVLIKKKVVSLVEPEVIGLPVEPAALTELAKLAEVVDTADPAPVSVASGVAPTPTLTPKPAPPAARVGGTVAIPRIKLFPMEPVVKAPPPPIIIALPPSIPKDKKKGKAAEKPTGPVVKEKAKKWRMSEWSGVTTDTDAAAAVVDPLAQAVEGATGLPASVAPVAVVANKAVVPETRAWQDFKPVHWKDNRRGGKNSRGRGRGAVATAAGTKPRLKVVKLYEGITVRELSELLGQRVPAIIGKLMEMGKMATINHPIDLTEAALIAEAFDVKAEMTTEVAEETLLGVDVPEDVTLRVRRPPVVTIMGHVDHGKTSLLDALREAKVAEGEAGGITQHIGAYTVAVGGGAITFLDTPGHEAFTAIRARGAKVTDIVVLVVAADDGVMPQTIEAIDHARAASVPIIVAINKIDKPEANVERVKAALAERDLIPEEWGGKTIYAEVSAKKKLGLDHFLEMLLLQADVMELAANPTRPMSGTIIEAHLDKGRGPIATVLVQEGTLKVGAFFVTGTCFGRVRALVSDMGKKVDEAGPSSPVQVIGLEGVPQAGDSFLVVPDDRTAKEIANNRMQRRRAASSVIIDRRMTLADLATSLAHGKVKDLPLIVKADVQGSLEALLGALDKVQSPVVRIRVIHTGIGGITESNVLLAAASGAIIIGFNVRPETKGRDLAEREQVDVRLYTIIYEAIADITSALEGLLDPTFKERVLGRVEVRQVFTIQKIGTIAGGYVVEGTILRASSGARVLRDSAVVYNGKLASLRRFKDDVREVAEGYECGIGIENFSDIKVGDVIEVYTQDRITGKL